MWFIDQLKRLQGSGKKKENAPQTKNDHVTDAQKKPEDEKQPNPACVTMGRLHTPSEEDYAQWCTDLWPLMERMAQKMLEASEAGRCSPFGVRYPLQGTQHYGCLMLENLKRDGVLWSLSAQVMRPESDLCIMHFITKGTCDEICSYLTNPNNMDELLASYKELSNSMNNR